MQRLIAVLLVAAFAWWGYDTYNLAGPPARNVPKKAAFSATSRDSTAAPADAAAQSNFTCDGRVYCSQMTSCEEATFFLQHCPNVKMDGDHDGIPCESQWCGR
jgi:Excalibur calcium-binding domain